MDVIDVAIKSVRTCGVVDVLWKLKQKSVSKKHYKWFFSLWVRFVTIMISEKKARIMTNNIVADINHILDVIAIINQATSDEEIRI